MHAKIMLLPSKVRDDFPCGFAEQLLIDISAAFGHTFVLTQEKIGKVSQREFGSPLTEEAVEACQPCQAVFLSDGDCPGSQELYDALEIPLRIRSYQVPLEACRRNENPTQLFVGTVLSLDTDTLRQAMRVAFTFTLGEGVRLAHVPPTGATKVDWEAAVRVQEVADSQVSTVRLSAPEAVSQLIRSSERMGLLLCPPYAGSILDAAAWTLCSRRALAHDAAMSEKRGVYSAVRPRTPEEDSEADPFSTACAVSRMLKYTLGLRMESACLDVAITNVLAAGWRTSALVNAGEEANISAQGVAELICQQLTLAGEMMRKSNS